MEVTTYKQKVVREVTGLKASLLDTWINSGLIIPEKQPQRRGHHAGYSVTNMVQLQVLDMLADAGVVLKYASRVVKTIDIGAPVWYNLETGLHMICLKAPNVPNPQPPEEWRLYLTINTPMIREEIESKLEAL